MKKLTIQKLSFTALFAVLAALIAAAFCFGTSPRTANAAQGDRFAISLYPGEHFDVRNHFFSGRGILYNWIPSSIPVPDYSDPFFEDDSQAGRTYTVGLQSNAEGLFLFTDSGIADPEPPAYLIEFLTFIRSPDGSITRISLTAENGYDPPNFIDYAAIEAAWDLLLDGKYNPIIFSYASDSVNWLTNGFYDVFSVLVVSNKNPENQTVYYPYESNASRFYYGPAQPMPPAPTKEGHTFTGWYLDEACTINAAAYLIEQDTTLYAGWSVNQYSVAFDTAGAVPKASVTLDYDSPLSDNVGADPMRYGYSFKGWKLNDQLIDDTTRLTAGNITLTAVWEQLFWTVSFMVDGALYIELEVPHGTSFANLLGIISTEYGITLDSFSDPEMSLPIYESVRILNNTTVYAEVAATPPEKIGFFQRIANWFSASWGWLIACVCLYGAGALTVWFLKK